MSLSKESPVVGNPRVPEAADAGPDADDARVPGLITHLPSPTK